MKKGKVQFVKHRLTGQVMLVLKDDIQCRGYDMVHCKYTNKAGEYKADYFEKEELEFLN